MAQEAHKNKKEGGGWVSGTLPFLGAGLGASALWIAWAAATHGAPDIEVPETAPEPEIDPPEKAAPEEAVGPAEPPRKSLDDIADEVSAKNKGSAGETEAADAPSAGAGEEDAPAEPNAEAAEAVDTIAEQIAALKAEVAADLGVDNTDAINVEITPDGTPRITVVDENGVTLANIVPKDSLDQAWFPQSVTDQKYIVATLEGDTHPYSTARELTRLGVIQKDDVFYFTEHLSDDDKGFCYKNNQLLISNFDGTWTCHGPDCPPIPPAVDIPVVPEPHSAVADIAPPEPESVTPPAVVEETPGPEPEPIPVTDRVRIFQSWAYGCTENGCGIIPTMFLTFDSVEDAREFCGSAEGQEFMRHLTEGGNNLGNCFYITDGEENLQQMSFETESARVGDTTYKRIVFDENGAPRIDEGTLKDARFNEERGGSTTLRGGTASHRISEEDFEERLARGIGDASDADAKKVPSVGGWNTNTIGVGNVQELRLNSETGQWEYVPLDQAVDAGEDAIADAGGLSASEYAALKSVPLPREFYDTDASFKDKWHALREAAEARGIDMSENGAKNMTRIIMEQGFGQDGNIQSFNEALVGEKNTQLRIPSIRSDGSAATVEDAVRISARNRELLLRDVTLGSR